MYVLTVLAILLSIIIVLGSVIWLFGSLERRVDRKAILAGRRALEEKGLIADKINIGSTWYVAHFSTDEGQAKARYTFNRQNGLKWETGALKPLLKRPRQRTND